MYSGKLTKGSTMTFSDKIKRLKSEIEECDALVIGAGAGLSTAAGLTYSGERFLKYFPDFNAKYGITDMYSGGFFPFKSQNEFWAYWSRHIYINRYAKQTNELYESLLCIAENKNYFVLTTNVDHCFEDAGFDRKRLFCTQGDYGLFQCSVPCRNITYENENIIREMVKQQRDMKIPDELIPICPVCSEPITVNLRCDDKFVQDSAWYDARARYENFLSENKGSRILLLELGVGGNTPVIIKYPFWQMTYENKNARYVCINSGEAFCPAEIAASSLCIDADISYALNALLKIML